MLAVEVDERAPGPECRSDAEIAEAVTRALQLSGALPDNAVQGMVDRGVVTLCGEVESETQRETAGVVARWLHGVTGVANLITVGSSVRYRTVLRSGRA